MPIGKPDDIPTPGDGSPKELSRGQGLAAVLFPKIIKSSDITYEDGSRIESAQDLEAELRKHRQNLWTLHDPIDIEMQKQWIQTYSQCWIQERRLFPTPPTLDTIF